LIRESRIAVTGAAGFIGLHLADFLASESTNKVHLIDNFARGSRDEKFVEVSDRKNVEFLDMDLGGDLSDFPDSDYVFHLASINGTENFYNSPFDVTFSAAVPTLRLIHHLRDFPLKKFILSSTSEVYAGAVELGLSPVPTNEETPLVINSVDNMRWSYAAGKIAAEFGAFGAASQFGFPSTVVRFHNVYGPRMGEQHVIPQFLRRAAQGDFSLKGSDNTRSFIFVEDAVRALAGVAEIDESSGQVINIGTDYEIKIKDLAERILDIAGIPGDLVLQNSPDGSVSRRCPDLRVLRSLTGFVPAIGLDEGLERTIKFYLGAWGYNLAKP
jgi:UDP-glucose 4-epimerase